MDNDNETNRGRMNDRVSTEQANSEEGRSEGRTDEPTERID